MDTLITHLEIFGIGLSFGIAGACLFTCTPIVVFYAAASHRNWKETLSKIFIFLSGRLLAYLALGYLAGLSGEILRRFIDSNLSIFFRPLSGAVAVAFAIFVFTHKERAGCPAAAGGKNLYDRGGLFLLGFSIGAVPCGPLVAILFNIVMMSKSAFDGAAYALSFGMGTFVSGLIVISALTGAVKWIPLAFLKSKTTNLIFKIICAGLLALFGLRLMIS